MAADIKIDTYILTKAPDGGYTVYERWRECGGPSFVIFASSTIDEALKYIRNKLEPKR